jgi:alpha/beta hydrolase family protein
MAGRTSFVVAGLTALGLLALFNPASPAQARITGISYTTSQPFGNQSFGAVGQYQQLDGTATGELDPRDPLNAIITDIGLAPKSHGKVQYSFTFSILMPVDLSKSNHTLFYDIVNRGNKVVTGWNIGGTSTAAGDGFLESQGFIMVWSGWEADMLTAPGRIQLTAPVATNPDGTSITGRIVTEYDLSAAASFVPLGGGPFAGSNGRDYDPVSLNNKNAILTQRVHQDDPKVPIPNSQWNFAVCTSSQVTVLPPDPPQICVNMLNGGMFDTDHIYELTYSAKDPLVDGIGLAAMRDFISFLRYGQPGVTNPLQGAVQYALMHGTSQDGRLARTFLDLGFNQDEQRRQVADGLNPHIGSVRNDINQRFAQAIRGPGLQHEEKLSTADADAPFTYGDSIDPVSGTWGGLLDRCRQSHTCPKIFHTNTDTEYWQGGMSLDTTDGRGHDLAIPDNVRIYHFASTQHGGFNPVSKIPTTAPAACQYIQNVNPYVYQQRALLIDLLQWVANGTTPPPSRYATVADNTLRPPALVGFPDGVFPSSVAAYPTVSFTGLYNSRNLLFWGPRFDADDESGVLAGPPFVLNRAYDIMEPAVDADGNDIDGVRSTTLQAPLGTYMGWNYRRAGFGQGDLCDLTGSFIPFAGTQAERLANGDPRPSLDERYGNSAGYVAAVTTAANNLVADRFLLPADAANIIANAASVVIP